MENSRVFDEFIELIKISSPSHSERKMADILKEKLLKLGLAVHEDNA